MGDVESAIDLDGTVQELKVRDSQSLVSRLALNYLAFTDRAFVGDRVLLNTTATTLRLGTGGYDFVISNLNGRAPSVMSAGHVMKARYLPCQHAVLTLEEQSEYVGVWDRNLDSMPVIVGELHSQVALVAAGVAVRGKTCSYIMTDGAAVPMGLSRLVRDLKQAGLLKATITTGQSFGGDYECVTVHSALLAARHIIGADVAIVCQGPGQRRNRNSIRLLRNRTGSDARYRRRTWRQAGGGGAHKRGGLTCTASRTEPSHANLPGAGLLPVPTTDPRRRRDNRST